MIRSGVAEAAQIHSQIVSKNYQRKGIVTMASSSRAGGRAELIAALNASRGLIAAVAFFSLFVNLLMLTGPLYMLNVYDRVLGSRTVETLVGLTLIVVFLYGMMGILDLVRGRLMSRVGARFQSRLDPRVFAASLQGSRIPRAMKFAASGSRDLESVQRLLTSPALMSIFDLPFTPFFLMAIFIFHP